MFDYFKKKAIENRASDEILYEYVTEELEKNIKVKGLWAKAYANSDGNDNKIEPLYMQYRVQAIKDVFASLEIMYNELSRQKLFDFISNGFKSEEIISKPIVVSREQIKQTKASEEKNKLFMNKIHSNYTCVGQNDYRKNGTDDIFRIETDNKIYKLTKIS